MTMITRSTSTIMTTIMRSTSITTTTIMRSMSTITTMITTSMSTTMTMSMASAAIRTAPATTITTTPMRSSPPGAGRRPGYTQAEISRILTELDSGAYGKILRAKGIVSGGDGTWVEFDYVPGEQEVRAGHPDYTGRLCVIGAELDEARSGGPVRPVSGKGIEYCNG